MGLMHFRRFIFGTFAMLAFVAIYQSCSEVEFNSAPATSFSKSGGGDPPSCREVSISEVTTQDDVSLIACEQGGDEQCVLVCHVPPGNPAAKHNIIIGLPARLGPHQPGGHGGDYDGPCSETDTTFEACVE